MVAIDRSWIEAAEEQRELDRLSRDPASARRRRVVGPVRAVAVVALVLGVVGLVGVVNEFGVGAGLALVWALPMLVLGIVLGAEKVLLHFTK